MSFEHSLPTNNPEVRERLYRGDLFQLAATAASRAAVQAARAVLNDKLRVSDPRQAHAELDEAEFFQRIGEARRILFLDPEWHERVRDIVAQSGFDPEHVAFDPIRLRVIAHRGHENPRARAVYYPHRDTWYSHPQAIITWWIPLDDLDEEETFWIYPERFGQSVPNNSEIFDYRDWVRDGWELKIGWQKRDAGIEARYPGIVGDPERGAALAFAAGCAENILFSGAHFHATRPQATGRTRYSLDFRILDLRDYRDGLGAPNVDSRCRGSAVVDYIKPPCYAGAAQ